MTELYYSFNPEWADIKPIPLDNGPNQLITIAYNKECKLFVVAFFFFFSELLNGLVRFRSNGLFQSSLS